MADVYILYKWYILGNFTSFCPVLRADETQRSVQRSYSQCGRNTCLCLAEYGCALASVSVAAPRECDSAVS